MDFSQANFIKTAEEVNKQTEQRDQLRQKYKVEAPNEVYNFFEDIVKNSENPEQEIYRLGTAYKFSENMGIPIGDAYSNLDSYAESVYGKPVEDYKGFFNSFWDSLYIGTLTRDIGRVGNEIRNAELEGNTELAEALYKELEAYQNEINVRREGIPQQGITQAFSQVAENLPFMLDTIAVNTLGNAIPGFGTLMSVGMNASMYAGQEYLELRKNGASVEGANRASVVSGFIQTGVELTLGNIAGAIGDITGVKTLSKEASQKITQKILAKPIYKKIISSLSHYGLEALEEGSEEVLQELVSITTEEILANTEGYNVDRENVAKTLFDNFKGGFVSSLILGIPAMGGGAVIDVTQSKKIRELAIEIESEKVFEKAVEKSTVFNGMTEEEKKQSIKAIWENFQPNRDEVFNQRVKEQAEVTDTASGYDTEIDAEYRQDGKLYTEDRQNEDGKNVFVIGNPDKEGSNLYGHIDYSIDGDTITIENFKMNENREALRTEVFQEFAEQHPGMKIEWETVGQVATDIKNELIANNPYGKENGLNYYKDEQSVADARTRRKVADEIGRNFKFDNKQKSAAVFVLEAMANSQGKNLTEYVGETFGRQIFGRSEEIERFANLQNETFQGKAGATRWFGRDMKAVIYAGEKGDFSTWVHELSHVYQRQLSGDLLTQAEKAFNVKNGDWHNSTYTFTNSKGKKVTYTSDEAFAYGFQDWLQTGKAPNQELKNIFEKFAEFLARCYNSLKNHLNLSKDIVDVYNQMLKGDDSMLALAERAVIENDRKRLADERIKQQQLEAEQQQKAQEEKAEQQAREEELAETTIKDDKISSEDDISVEPIPVEELVKAFEPHEETVKTLDDTSKSKTEKDKAVLETASEEKEEIELLFQMVGEETIRQMAESTYKRNLLSNLEKAKYFYAHTYKNLPSEQRAIRIKLQTGWEYDKNADKWKYETDDSLAKFKWGERFTEVKNKNPNQLAEALNKLTVTVGDMMNHEKLFNLFPWMKDINVKFTNRRDFLVSALTNEGILINLAYVNDKNVLSKIGHELQHLIQGVEHTESGYTGQNFKTLYDSLNKAINRESFTEEELTEAERVTREYMENAGEQEAREVAERYMLASHDRASHPINFQLIGEQGAEQLDIAEETTVRMDNLNIAMHMEANGSTPKEIRLATSWERGADGQWKYEIDDAYNVDFEYKAIDFVKNNPRFTELENKLAEGDYNWDNLTEEEQKEFDKLSDEFNKGYYTNETTLKDIIDAPELFRAYPQLKKLVVKFSNKPGLTTGQYQHGKIVDTLFEIEEDYHQIEIFTLPNSDNVENIKTTLLHEIQHAIQRIEGFAKGGTESQFKDKKIPAKLKEQEFKRSVYSGLIYKEILKENPSLDKNKNYITPSFLNEFIKENKIDVSKYEHGEEYQKLNSLLEDYDNNTAYKKYRRLAGEVEARNVQERYRRFKANQKARQETLLSETEDVPRDEQIILFQEEQDVRNQYENTDKWLKAPNGNDTNLTEKQWLQVRTPSFKKWFGDWENDPENASKVVDENGEPLVVYHGTLFSNFDVFEPSNGISFFTPTKEQAMSYGGSENAKYIYDEVTENEDPGVFSCFLNIRNPKVVDFHGLTFNGENVETGESEDLFTDEEAFKAKEEGFDGTKLTNIRYDWSDNFNIEVTDENIINDDYVVFSPNQIKSATDNSGEFNADNPSILFQEAYHGTPHNFDKFSTSAIGTGEGAQSFGWGLYFTNQEDIARWYADKLTNTEENEEYTREIEELEKEVQSLKVIVDVYKTKLKENNLSKRIKSNIETALPDFLKKIESKETSIKLLKETLNKQNKRNLYTVELPDNGYLLWDKEYDTKDLTSLKQPLFNRLLDEYFGGDKESTQYEVDSIFYDGITGEEFYHSLQHELGSDKAASLFLKENGYIGIDYPANSLAGHTEEGKRNYTIFDENDIEIKEHINFQNEQSLYGVHNLSKEALEHAFKMGGLPNPSLAVTDKDLGFSSFGEISLIPYSLMLEKGNGNAGTFGADIYSPRYPSITRIVTDTGRNKVKALFWAIENEELKREAISKTISSIEDRTRNIDLYRGLQLAYLEEKEIKDYYVYEKSNYSDEIKEKIKNLKTDDADDPETKKIVTDIVLAKKRAEDRVFAKMIANRELKEEKGNYTEEELEERIAEVLDYKMDFFKKENLDKDGLLSFRTVDDFIYDVKKDIRDAGKIDTYYTYQKATDYIKENNLTKDFEKWAKEQLDKVEIEEKIFNGYTPSGNIRYLDHTLENVSKWMKKQGLQGGEGFGYGLGSVRAQFTPKFHSLSEIKAEKGRLRNTADFEEIKEEYNNRFNKIIERLSGDNSYDVGAARFEEAFTQNDPIGYLEKEYGLNINSDFADEMFKFAEALKEMPTEYFETKYTRPVMLNEFAAAIVPSNLPQELKDKLEQEGLIVKEYTDNRQEEVNKALEEINETRDVLFQTEGELLEEARSFDSWQEWKEYVETFADSFDYDQVPNFADDTWYRTTWELANREPQQEGNTDENFIDYMSNRENLKDFLAEIANIDSTELWQPSDEEEAREIEDLQNKKDIIDTKLAQWKGFARGILYGNELKESTYKNLETQIKNKPRDFRELFTQIMDNQTYAVSEDEKTSTQLQKKYKLSDVEVNEIENSSPEKRRQIARELSNKDIAERLANGTLEMGQELYDYIDSLNKEIGKLQEQYDQLETEVQEDFQRISNWEDRELLKLHEQLLEAKENYELKSDDVARKIDRGIRVTKKYKDASVKAKANYDTIFKKFNDLSKSYEISNIAKEAMTRKEKISDIKKKLKAKQEERRLSQEIKKLRVQLVKRTMRRIKFDTVNYEQGRQIIAIQRLFEPNLMGGINKWLGTDGESLRAVYSKWNTDTEYREKMKNKLANKKGGYDAIQLLDETDNIAKFNEWTKGERALLYKVLPRENWIKELNLEELAEERAKAFKMDIGLREVSQWITNDKGENELVTMEVPVVSEEVETLVKDAIGTTLYNQLVSRPFAEWTTEEMESLAKRVNELYKEGRDELANKNLIRKQEAADIRHAIERAVKDTGIVINDDDSEEVKKKKLEKIAKILGDDPTLKGTSARRTSKWQKILEGYGDARLISVARLLDNNRDGINVSELYRKENDSYNARERKIKERTDRINKVMSDNKITLKDLYSTVKIDNWYKGESVTFTVDELLFMAKAAEDEQSKNAVMYGNLFSSERMLQDKQGYINNDNLYGYEAICNALYKKVLNEVKKLDSKFLKFADAISEDYAEQYERMNKVSIEEFNQPVNRVENYVPIVRLESSGDTNENRVLDDFMAGHGLTKKGVDKGMTKSRVEIGAFHQKPIELGLYKTWVDSVNRTEHFIAYSPYVRELNRVYKSQEADYTRQFIGNRYGQGMLHYIDSYIAEVANPNANVQFSQLDNLIRTLRGKTAPAYLAWKTSSMIKQFITSPMPFLQFCNPLEYLKASFDCIQGKTRDAIKEKSIFMRNRKFDPIQDLIKEQEEKNTNKAEAVLNKFNSIGMKGLEAVDWGAVAPGWLACYRKKLNELNAEKQKIFDAEYFKTNDKKKAQEKANQITEDVAVQYADECVRLCQPSNRKVDLAPLFKESSEVAKAYLQFQTSLNVIWNNIRYDLPYAIKNKQFKNIVGSVTGYVMAGLFMNLVCSGFDEDDEEEDKIKKSIFYATTQFTDAIPVLGSAVTKVTEKVITGESSYSMGTDLTPMVTKFMQGVQAIPKAQETGEWEKVCGKFAEAMGLSLGLPVSGVKEIKEVIDEQSLLPILGR